MNSIFTVVDFLMKTGNVDSSRDISGKLENWKNKVDDDYSLVYNHEMCKYFGRHIIDMILGSVIGSAPQSSNIGFKVIGPSVRDLNIANELGFHVIYVRRNLKDALSSYMNQWWSSLHNFNLCVTRSEQIQKSVDSWAGDSLSILEYDDIHNSIYGVMDKLELKYDKEKIESVLSNKINPGYYTEKELEKISTK